MTSRPSVARAAATAVSLALVIAPLPSAPALAAEVSLTAGDNADLAKTLKAASLSVSAIENDKVSDPQELIADAKADYQRLVAALYDKGYFGASVSILVDGKEASGVPVLGGNTKIGRIEIRVDPGPRFKFSEAEVTPLPKGAAPYEGFAPGQTASTGVMRKAAAAGVEDWRNRGHAKAAISDQKITANHDTDTVAARFGLTPGPQLTFGTVTLSERSLASKVRAKRIRAIAGLPVGKLYSPEEISKAESRLRRAGAFSSATVAESDSVGPDNTLPTTIDVVDSKPRRLGFGAEVTTEEGATISGYWLHRNLLGGAERLRIDGEVSGIGGTTGGGMDYSLKTTLTYPAFKNPDMDLVYGIDLEHEDEEEYISDVAEVSVGVDRYLTSKLTANLRLGLRYSHTEDNLGDRDFQHITFKTGLTWDNRNDKIDPTDGVYAQVSATPFLGVSGTASGLLTEADLRGYRELGTPKLAIASRVQIGNIQGPSIEDTPSDWLFWSGGGGSVRGQGYQSLGTYAAGVETGGLSYSAISTELRSRIGDSWGAVAFVDYGYVSGYNDFSSGEWQGGAGIGARYFTGIGPIRLDVAVPVTGNKNSVSVYVGIGQSF
ncbi:MULTISPECIES: autotransporter assembly complex protein TamA [Pseudooceanicola]|nr:MULTISPECIES: BamA/TamA family outer membrane protein [Pseudooceanicola]